VSMSLVFSPRVRVTHSSLGEGQPVVKGHNDEYNVNRSRSAMLTSKNEWKGNAGC
jgi:hypothetical protein